METVAQLQQNGDAMRSFVLSLTASVALAAMPGATFAQSSHSASTAASAAQSGNASETSKTKTSAKTSAKAAPLQKASVARSMPRPAKPMTHPRVQATRYGVFMMAPPPPPPELDTTSPRTLSLVNVNTSETISVTYWSDGAYHRDALDKLNAFCRDTHEEQKTEMDPLLFDVLWHTANTVHYTGPIEVFSAFRSPTTNAWLASMQRGVASDSQHINGNAMDIRFPGVPVFQVRQAARSLNMGGVGFYPRSGFVHLDTGPVRYW
jgi:uncharacterized protein YcbK (DUF882 family)